MTKKKNNLISIIPAFLLMGTAVGVQTGDILKYAVVGFIVGVIVYFFLSYRNKKIKK
jgi:ABC-type antimicrobial peptide transport system permease subunit